MRYQDQNRSPRAKSPVPVIIISVLLLVCGIVLLATTCSTEKTDITRSGGNVLPQMTVTPIPSEEPVVTPRETVPLPTREPTPEPTAASTPQAMSVYTTDPSLTASAAPTAETDAVLSTGSRGDEVKKLQERLRELGFLDGEADGIFGNGTKAAVKWFQRQNGLAADGIAGMATKTALYAPDAQRARVTNVMTGDIPLLINRDHTVDALFVPQDLVYLSDVIPSELCTYKTSGLMGVREAAEALAEMLSAAHADGLTEWQFSEAYRSWDRQQQIFDNSVGEFMEKNGLTRSKAISATRQTVADPGASEHHSGLAFDITVPGKYFSDTAQYLWMKKHCWEYGFILRYTDENEDITGFLGEEWHYRYVGKEHSMCMYEMDLCLEEYVEYLESR